MIYLHGTGHFHPENVIDNRFLENLDIGCDTAWTLERVGIETRRTVLPLDYIRQTRNKNILAAHEASLYTNAETGSAAAKMAISRAGISNSDIGMVISGSCTPQHRVPAEACTIAAKLNIEAPAFDMNSACSSFIAHLSTLNVSRPEALPEFILLVCPENTTRVVDYNDRNSAVLWGDGSSAAVVSTKVKSRASFSNPQLESSPRSWETVTVGPGKHFQQSGRTVQTFAIKKMLSIIQKVRAEVNAEDIARFKFIGHQANLLMLESVCKFAEIRPENHFSNVARVGNCGASGAPTVLSEIWENLIEGDRIALALVGAGLSWGGTLLSVGPPV